MAMHERLFREHQAPHDGGVAGGGADQLGKVAVPAVFGESSSRGWNIGERIESEHGVEISVSPMLVGEPRKDGSLSAVRAAIRAGGSVIAIVENKTRDPYNSERYDTESFSFVRLGLGHNKPSAEGEDSIGTGFVVDTVSRDELTQPGPSSVIEPKKVTLTRENFGGDPQVSREHCSVTFDPTLMGGTGDIVVRDGNEAGRASTNGTYLVTAETYNGGREITGEEASLYGVLKENPGAWDPKVIAGIEKQAQGRHVPIISPQG